MKQPRWTQKERDRLLHLRDVERLKWDAVAARMPGRTRGSCIVQYYDRLRAFNKAQQRPEEPGRYGPKPIRAAPPPLPAPKPARPSVPEAVKPVAPPLVAVPAPADIALRRRTAALEVLRAEAELRARIAERGLTGGLFGDPAPGRSALDRRLAGPDEPRKPALQSRGFNGWS
jgi:hypothetical protein